MKKTKGLFVISFIQVQIMSCDSRVPLLLLEAHWSETTNYLFTELWLVYIYLQSLMCILDRYVWQKICRDSWIVDLRVKNPDTVCGCSTGCFWQVTLSLVSANTLSGLFRREAPVHLANRILACLGYSIKILLVFNE